MRAIGVLLAVFGLGLTACTSKDAQLVAEAKGNGGFGEFEPERLPRMVKLLNRGADVNARDSSGTTVLMLALANQQARHQPGIIEPGGGVDTAQALIRRGANVNASSLAGVTALDIAASKYSTPELIELLIEAGANPNVKGGTQGALLGCPLRHASSLDNMRSLLSHGADANFDDGRGSLLQGPAKASADRLLLLLRHGANPDGLDSDDRWPTEGYRPEETPLMIAIGSGEGTVDRTRLLLDAGANPDLGDVYGSTPLMRAAIYGPPDLVRMLIDKHVNLNARDRHGSNALSEARDDRIAQMLLEAGAKISEAQDQQNELIRAAAGRKDERLAMLVRYGGRVHPTEWPQQLRRARRAEGADEMKLPSPRIIGLLLDAGGRPDLPDILAQATAQGRTDIVALLKARRSPRG